MKKLLCAGLFLAMATAPVFAADLASDANYKAKCAGCHGANGEGKAAMKTAPLKDAASKDAADLTTIITKGKAPRMPAFDGKLTPDQVKAMVEEIKAQK